MAAETRFTHVSVEALYTVAAAPEIRVTHFNVEVLWTPAPPASSEGSSILILPNM